MEIGVAMFPTDYSISPADLAVACEERGLESLWIPEHSHIPASLQSEWPGGPEMPKHYFHCMDPFVSLAAAAAVTKTIKLATGICLVVQRDPIQLAKQVSTLDQISDGRFILGVGGGWNAEEMENHGTDYKTRFRLMRERISAMKAIWTQDDAEHHGEFVNFGPIIGRPKPVQKPHPPIIIGGGYPHSARRAIEYGNGWIPVGHRDLDIQDLMTGFHKLARDAGRDPESLSVSVFGLNRVFVEPNEYFRSKDDIARFRDAGVHRVVFMLPTVDRTAVLPMLDQASDFSSIVKS